MTAEDVSALAALAARVPTAPHWPLAEFERMAGIVATEPERRGGWVALTPEMEPAVAGFAFARRNLDEAELESIVTAPELRRQGIGKMLLHTALEWATTAGAGSMLLECRASNEAALGLYRRYGFVPEGRRRNYYVRPDEDAVLMRHSFGSADAGTEAPSPR